MASYRPEKLSISPHSSPGNAESVGGTPDTSLTAFSPEDLRRGSFAIALSAGAGAGAGASSRDDPFVTVTTTAATAAASRKTTLSANAVTFQPSRADSQSYTITVSGDTTESGSSTPSSTHFGIFTTDTGASRCIKVCAIYDDADVPGKVMATMKNLAAEGVINHGSQRFDCQGNKVFIRFPNIKEANAVYNTIRLEHQALAIEYMNPVDWAMVASPSSRYSAHEGQVVLTALYPATVAHNKKSFEQHLRQLLGVSGELVAWQKIAATEAGTFKMVAEFFDANNAIDATQRVNGRVLTVGKAFIHVPYSPVKVEVDQTVTISVHLHQPDITTQSTQGLAGQLTPTRSSSIQSFDLNEALGNVSLGMVQPPFMGSLMGRTPTFPRATANRVMACHQYDMAPLQPGYYPTGSGQDHTAYYERQNLPYGPREVGLYQGYNMAPRGYVYNQQNARRQNAVKIPGRPRNNNSTASSHNYVDVEKIHEGADVRTTVMLRNIPNKLSQAQLKEIVDESSSCKYDFMYLRIDFSNDCNVGYAFINFTDPLDIIDFVHARSGQKWYKSDKVAEVSYATIQGKDCLVQKFRNSSVMLEPAHYRPKLYFTIHDGALAGQEERFPESDNASKLKRSCENAEHVGLFAPSSGNGGVREEHRRRGNFDRGTSLAQREEYDYNGRPFDRSYNVTPYRGVPY